MKNYQFIFLFFFYSGVLQAQAVDNFSDGNFTQDPVWSGSSGHFIINASQQLQLNNSLAGSSFLSTSFAASSLDNFEWQVFVRQAFSPSGSNYGRVYLTSDQMDLSAPLNGYYLQFGEAGSNDAVQLFQQTGLVSTSICRAMNGAIATSFMLRVKVQRDSSGFWKLLIDYSGGTNFVQEASGTEQTQVESSFLGVFCTYTVSNASKFYWDDFIAGPQQLDANPPAFESMEVLSPNSLSLHFSEPLERVSAVSTIHYSANNSLGNPLTATLESDESIVDLFFKINFSNGVQNQLLVSGLKDLAGNSMNASEMPFMFLLRLKISTNSALGKPICGAGSANISVTIISFGCIGDG